MEYTLEVTTGSTANAGTFNNVFVTLIGVERQSERTQLTSFGLDDKIPKVGTFSVTTLFSLGCLLLLKLEKDPFHELPENNWFCSKIVVTTPEKDQILFPCQTWLSRGEFVILRGGRATKAFEDLHPQLVQQRKKELVQQKSVYNWGKHTDGLPHIFNLTHSRAIPAEMAFSFSKAAQVKYVITTVSLWRQFLGVMNSTEPWESFEAMREFSWLRNHPIAEYVSQRWKDDDFFGYQFLNGPNYDMIRRCTKLPPNFPVTDEMVKPFLENGSSLTVEMEKGNIYISDYKIMEGLPTRIIDGKPAVLVAALCLLYLNPEKKLLPIAIQLSQQPSEKNPIFLPSDLESDWLLAKTFVRHADSLYASVVTHFFNTHDLSEVFAMATLRNLPMIHPLYKLLIPHFRSIISLNIYGHLVFGRGGTFTKFSLEEDGIEELLRRRFSQMTYSNLCLPENIAARGLESIPNFHFRNDALRLWNIINSYVKAMVVYYYPSDSEVSADSELQEWINEIFHYGFLGNDASGIPSHFQTVEELIKFVTMVIFTPAKHGAVHHAQFDFTAWTPNSPLILHQAPPTKGKSSMETVLATLPQKSYTVLGQSLFWLLSWKFDDFVPLGTYPEERFAEPAALQMIKDFQAELSALSESISKRNSELELPYPYLNPKEVENSISF